MTTKILKTLVYGFLAVILTFTLALAFTACDNGTGGEKDPDNGPDNGTSENTAPEDLTAAERWFAFVDDSSTATLDLSVNNKDVCTVTVSGTDVNNWKAEAKYKYTGKENTSYIYVFEAWTESGNRTLQISYFDFSLRDLGIAGTRTLWINSTRETYILYGPKIPMNGVRTFEINCANQLGTFYVKMISITEYNEEKRPVAERWNSWATDDATATITHSVDIYGVCTITVGGVAQVNNETDGWGRWKARAYYIYTAEANTKYEYKFEAWTKSGDLRNDLLVVYYEGTGNTMNTRENITTLSETPQIFTITGNAVPKGGYLALDFDCGDQLGTFYVRVISIKPVP